jgi:hypothetical protein
MRGDDPASVIGHHVIAKRGELGRHDVVVTGQNRTDLALDAVQVEIPSRLTEAPRAVDEGDHPQMYRSVADQVESPA